MQGLLYLEENSLSHTKLTCSNVLIDIHGTVKLCRLTYGRKKTLSSFAIGGQEFIRTRFNLNEAIQRIAIITMKLAQGYADKDGRFLLDSPERFPLASDFLGALEQMTSIGELNQVCLNIFRSEQSADLPSTHCCESHGIRDTWSGY